MRRVLIIGATGDLGRVLCRAYQRRGWYVVALVPPQAEFTPIAADQLVEAQLAQPSSLEGVMTDVTLIVSCLGISSRGNAPDGSHVDYQTNLTLLRAAQRAGVGQFVHAHALRGLEEPQVLRALCLDAAEDDQAPTSENHAENRPAEPRSAHIHHLSIERKNS